MGVATPRQRHDHRPVWRLGLVAMMPLLLGPVCTVPIDPALYRTSQAESASVRCTNATDRPVTATVYYTIAGQSVHEWNVTLEPAASRNAVAVLGPDEGDTIEVAFAYATDPKRVVAQRMLLAGVDFSAGDVVDVVMPRPVPSPPPLPPPAAAARG